MSSRFIRTTLLFKGRGEKKRNISNLEWNISRVTNSSRAPFFASLLTRFCVSAKAARITDKMDNGKTSNLGGEKKRRNDGRKIEGIRVVER